MKTNTIALLSDFGTTDPFVSAIKGVLYTRIARLTIIDITHDVPPQDIQTGAFYLMAAMPYMPKSTLFINVVDPTVGTGRGIIWAKTEHYQFIAPDNGLISWVEQAEKIKEARFISNSGLFSKDISATFHGRDIMAPVAAAIAKGLPEKKIGPVFNDYRKLPFPRPEKAGNRVTGQVIAIDHFGNAITNIRRGHVNANAVFAISERMIKGLKLTYASVPEGEALAVIGSFGFLEFSVRNGNFARAFDVKIGSPVEAMGSIDERLQNT